MRNRMTRMAAAIIACTGTLFFGSLLQSAVAQDTANLPYMNPKLSPEQRAADLVRRMTLAEKATQMQNNSAALVDEMIVLTFQLQKIPEPPASRSSSPSAGP
jgi:beta-glucosidase